MFPIILRPSDVDLYEFFTGSVFDDLPQVRTFAGEVPFVTSTVQLNGRRQWNVLDLLDHLPSLLLDTATPLLGLAPVFWKEHSKGHEGRSLIRLIEWWEGICGHLFIQWCGIRTGLQSGFESGRWVRFRWGCFIVQLGMQCSLRGNA